jgi:hypothetical protein
MQLDPDDPEFKEKVSMISGDRLDEMTSDAYRQDILEARSAGIPLGRGVLNADDFLPAKKWDIMAVSGYMLPDPYSGSAGVRQVGDDTYEVTTRMTTRAGDRRATLTLRLLEEPKRSRLVFNPLLNRFMHGEDYHHRPVKISDSGRIRNELQTLCSEALEHIGPRGIRVHFERISDDVIPKARQGDLREILEWYKANHPIWFSWLEIA